MTAVRTTDERLAEIERLLAELVSRLGTVEPSPKYVDAKAIAEHFGVSRATVHNWTTKEDCPHILRGGVLRFEVAAVEAWFRGREPGLRRVK